MLPAVLGDTGHQGYHRILIIYLHVGIKSLAVIRGTQPSFTMAGAFCKQHAHGLENVEFPHKQLLDAWVGWSYTTHKANDFVTKAIAGVI